MPDGPYRFAFFIGAGVLPIAFQPEQTKDDAAVGLCHRFGTQLGQNQRAGAALADAEAQFVVVAGQIAKISLELRVIAAGCIAFGQFRRKDGCEMCLQFAVPGEARPFGRLVEFAPLVFHLFGWV